ncbi:MAG TPA: glycosyltransferase family 1 protein, partial [Ardenticatenaceae bacterium]|nr:glycosyltransferase family 1 protein [Ardenticatenaceae bacterium]
MRIGLDTQAVGPRKTGIGQYTYSLLAALRQLAPEHEYVELSPGWPVALRTDRRVWWQQIGLPQRARAAAVDVLHVTGFDAPIWKPCPVVLTVHDLIPRLFPRNLPPISRLYWARWLPATVRFADMVIADSESTRRDIIRLLGVPERHVEVIPLGVGEQFTPQSQQRVVECRAKYGLAQPFILFVSTLEPRKGIDTL